MEHKTTEQACEEYEIQKERCHQDFIMMMMMVTGAKSPALSLSSPSLLSSSNLVTPTKGAATTSSIATVRTKLTAQTEEDELEKSWKR
eukprot:12353209-Ditylum_brightwellii.AAC.1